MNKSCRLAVTYFEQPRWILLPDHCTSKLMQGFRRILEYASELLPLTFAKRLGVAGKFGSVLYCAGLAIFLADYSAVFFRTGSRK